MEDKHQSAAAGRRRARPSGALVMPAPLDGCFRNEINTESNKNVQQRPLRRTPLISYRGLWAFLFHFIFREAMCGLFLIFEMRLKFK